VLRAISLGLAQLFSGRILGIIGACTMLSVACFAGVWYGLYYALEHWLGSWEFATTLGGVTTLVLAWFLFPLVAGVFVALFLDAIATIVEQQHYPELPKADGLSFGQSLVVALRYLVVLVLANVALLVLLLFPPVYAVAWFVVNGWLVGREYFELVAMRRLTPKQADELRGARGGEVFVTGMVIAGLLTIPFVNLVLPIVATAVMVHRYHDWRREAAAPS